MGDRKNCLVREGHVCGGQVTRASLQGFLRASVHVSLGNRAGLGRMARKLVTNMEIQLQTSMDPHFPVNWYQKVYLASSVSFLSFC